MRPVALLLVLFLLISQIAIAQYKPGTYKGSAQGRKDKTHSGLVEVEVTVNESKIENIKVLAFEQTSKGKYGALSAEAKGKIPVAIKEKQSIKVDAVTKATMSSNAISLAVARALEKASIKKYKPGVYKGSAKGRKDKKHTGLVEVEVTVSASAIEDIKVVTFEQTDKGKYGKLSAEAKATIPKSIVTKQSIEVDVITKATMSSNAIMIAVANALEQARLK